MLKRIVKTSNIVRDTYRCFSSGISNNKQVVYSWGCGVDGKLGIGSDSGYEAYPVPIAESSLLEIKNIVCGNYHTMLLDRSGKVYSFGWTSFVGGDRTVKETDRRSLSPKLITSLEAYNIVALAGGRRHTLAVDSEGRVHVFGVGSEHQLGTNSTKNEPSAVMLPQLLFDNQKVVQVAAGWGHSLALTENGNIYSWGWTQGAQTGQGYSSDTPIPIPKRIETLGKCKQIHSGFDHCMAISVDNDVYVWGSNEFGQLGLGHTNNQSTPTKLDNIKVDAHTKVSLGFGHSLIVDQQGNQLYSFGLNGNGQLGLGNKQNYHTPQRVEFDFDQQTICQVSAGRAHSAALTNNGRLYLWGNASKGKLGHGSVSPDETHPIEIYDFDENKPQSSPLESQIVTLVTCGFDHTLALIKDK
ncbi:hypothetical protein CYY_006887 [Polysphondylium violaceum]|uniref:RCC1-like domain-containing protein n=1 Tax=Polysphondylium violaceum TaxID=133409 RepID=A0A8J4UYF0_9MYCE|nr:hypothetical protein CYY_006887 [Polysphondylium violaceum]